MVDPARGLRSRRSCCCSTSRSSTSRCPTSRRDLDASFSEPAVGGRRLRADARRLPADRRLARRPARPPARLRDRLRGLHLRLARSAASPSDPTVLNLARGLQGVGGAVMFATSLALIAPGVPGPRAGHGVRRLGRDGRRRGRDRAAGRRRRSPRASAGSGSSSSTSRSGSRAMVADRAQDRRRHRDRPASRSTAPAWSPSRLGALPADLRR